jgi:predicted Ser/Thr protein kinase
MSATPTPTRNPGQFTETRILNPRTVWLVRFIWLAAVLLLLFVTITGLTRFIQQPIQSCLCESIRFIDQRDGLIVLNIYHGGSAAGKIENGDVLVAINGERLPVGISPEEAYHLTTVYPPETTLTLTVRTGDGPEGVVTLDTVWPLGNLSAPLVIMIDIIIVVWSIGIALFIAIRRSDDWMALFTSYVLLAFGITGMLTIGYGWTGDAWKLFRLFFNINGNFLPVLLLMIFPDGKPAPRWSLAIPITFGLWYLITNFLFIPIDPLLDTSIYIGFALSFVLILRHRYIHVFTPMRRQQTKFVLLGIALWLFTNGFLQLVQSMFLTVGQDAIASALDIPFLVLLNLVTLIVPVSIMFAILRFGLYDIDLVINRSLVYGAVSLGILVIFGIGFVAAYVITQQIFGVEYAVVPLAVGTLLSVIAFNRLRSGAQRFVDRRIYKLNFDLDQLAKAQETPNVKNPGALTGKTIGGFKVLGVLGKGGMGEVYQGETDGKSVALKILPEDLAQKSDFLSRFEREASIMRSLDHPNIVKLVSSGEQDNVHYLAMEYVQGTDLSSRLSRTGKMTYEDGCVLLRELAAALDHAHLHGLVHRDIKASNVLLRGDDPPQVLLTDFGIAKIKDATTRYTASGAIGTIDYMAPEQIMAAKEVDKRADIYALGIMAYEILTGELPFKGGAARVMFAHLQQPPPDACDVVAEIPKRTARAIQRAMSKVPEDRYNSAGEFAMAL